MKYVMVLSVICLLSGCASGQLDLYGSNGEKIGECTAGYEWHPIGVEHSVNWLLNYCYETALANGDKVERVSDAHIIKIDYSYPAHPSGAPWNKKLAWSAYWSNVINEQEYGYIVADLENIYYLSVVRAETQLLEGAITQSQFDALVSEAKSAFYGK